MSFFDELDDTPAIDSVGSASDLLNRNLATTAGVVTAAGLGVSAVALATAVAPVQVLITAGGAGALLEVGRRQHIAKLKDAVDERTESIAARHASVAA